MTFLEELRRTTAAAQSAQRVHEQVRKADDTVAKARRQAKLAEEIVSGIPAQLRHAAAIGATSCEIMQLREWNGDFTGSADEVHDKVTRLRKLDGIISGVAYFVATELINLGLAIYLEKRHHDDEGQGRSFYTLHLHAIWK